MDRQGPQSRDLGYAVLQVPDHLGNQFSPTLALMAAAEASRTLRLGTLVLDINYRHLALLAKEVATLDLLSEGRSSLDWAQDGSPESRR